MARNPKAILSEIKGLVNELETVISGESSVHKKLLSTQSSAAAEPKGVLGAITILIDKGFFNTLKDLAQIMEKLELIGHFHKRSAVSMNLLNLTKRGN